jgi:hypothetical protein
MWTIYIYISNVFFLYIKCAPFLFKIGDDINTDVKEKFFFEINDFFPFIMHLNSFGLNMLLALIIMKFDNVFYKKLFILCGKKHECIIYMI